MSGSEIEFRVLGPLAAVQSGSPVALGGRRQRLVLALLLLGAGRAVSADRLVDEIWGATAPSTGTGPLRTYIWKLRQLLGCGTDTNGRGGEILVSRGGGYVLHIEPHQIDSVRFEKHVASARAAAARGEPERALDDLADALDLWRGPAFGDLATEQAIRIEAVRLDQLHLEAHELRAELWLTTGQNAQVATELAALARAHPERERMWAMLMTALYRSGRQGEALRCYHEARATLIDTMGLEPGPELRDLEQAILCHDPALDGQRQARLPVGVVPAVDQADDAAEADTTGRRNTSWSSLPEARTAGRHNLPRRLTSFVGRAAELAAITRALDGSRLITLAGSGGSGKTRLALAVAELVLPRFPGGVWFVDLSAVADPELVARVISESLGVEVGRADRLEYVCRQIADEPVLLVLDNCEHLVQAVAETAEQLLSHCPSLHILATSREELRLGAESVWRVPGLSLPSTDGNNHDQVPHLGSEAVQLFVERGRAALAGFEPTGGALDAAARICQRLDGIPLAIELAAALVGSLPVTDIAERLDDRFALLTEGRRQSLPRHRTLRAALDWSFDLLDEEARTLFIDLSVFVGDFTLPAAEAVAGRDGDPLAVARGLGHLVRTSMVDCVAGNDGAQRYRMLETIRQYARERLDQVDRTDETHWRHARYYRDFAAEAERHVHGPAGSTWLARVVAELANLQTALTWTFSHDDIETGLRLAGSLHWFFARMGLVDEATRWLEAGLSRKAGLPPDLQLMTLTTATSVAFMRGELSRAHQFGDAAIALARQLGDARQLAIALIGRGATAVYQEDLLRAEECFEEAHDLSANFRDRWGLAWMLSFWGVASRLGGNSEHGRRQLEEALAIFRDLGDSHGEAMPLINLAIGAHEEGRPDEALELARDAARVAFGVEDREMQHVSLCVLGLAELAVGHRARARDQLVRCLRDFPGSRNQLMVNIGLEGLAGLSAIAGHFDHATALLGFTEKMRDRWNITLDAARDRQRKDLLDVASAEIGPAQVKLTLDRGRRLDVDQAISIAEAATTSFATLRSDISSEAKGFDADLTTS